MLKYVRPGNGFEPKFDVMAKVNVNGAQSHPLFTWMRESVSSTRLLFIHRFPYSRILYTNLIYLYHLCYFYYCRHARFLFLKTLLVTRKVTAVTTIML